VAAADYRRADFSPEAAMKGFTMAGDQGGDGKGAKRKGVPHTVIALAKRPITFGECETSWCGASRGLGAMNVAVLTQATHRYASWPLHALSPSPPESTKSSQANCTFEGLEFFDSSRGMMTDSGAESESESESVLFPCGR